MSNEQLLAQMLAEALKELDIVKEQCEGAERRGDVWFDSYVKLNKEFEALRKLCDELKEKLGRLETPMLIGEEE